MMIDLDKNGSWRYNQRKRVISPDYVCFTNNMCQAYGILTQDDDCLKNVMNYHTEFQSVADKLTYFMRFEPMIREVYKFYFPKEYNDWIMDKTKDRWFYSNNSYPPNELFKVMCIGFNLFVNMNRGDSYKEVCYTKDMTIETIKEELNNKRPVVASFKLGNILGHIMTIKGYDDNNFIVYDTYGCSYLKKFESKGNSKLIPFDKFVELCKSLNGNEKLCVCFN